jgi:hypothetical protein
MHWRFGKRLVPIFLAVSIASCNHQSPSDDNASTNDEVVTTVSTSGRIIQEVKKGLGIACRVGPETGSFSYLVSDIGHPGAPQPNNIEMQKIDGIRKYVHSKDLRFQYLGGHFIVYDATLGPCETAAPGYKVLTAPGCLYYSPTDDFDAPRSTPDCTDTPAPWIHNKAG